MQEYRLLCLAFVGGPFDGFQDEISADESLPDRVALPLTMASSEIFGTKLSEAIQGQVAIYRLTAHPRRLDYQFVRMSRMQAINVTEDGILSEI